MNRANNNLRKPQVDDEIRVYKLIYKLITKAWNSLKCRRFCKNP